MQFEGREPIHQAICMADFFSPWGPTTKRRVLSDKNIKKEKKLSLSLTSSDATSIKSTRKLALSASFQKFKDMHS